MRMFVVLKNSFYLESCANPYLVLNNSLIESNWNNYNRSETITAALTFCKYTVYILYTIVYTINLLSTYYNTVSDDAIVLKIRKKKNSELYLKLSVGK